MGNKPTHLSCLADAHSCRFLDTLQYPSLPSASCELHFSYMDTIPRGDGETGAIKWRHRALCWAGAQQKQIGFRTRGTFPHFPADASRIIPGVQPPAFSAAERKAGRSVRLKKGRPTSIVSLCSVQRGRTMALPSMSLRNASFQASASSRWVPFGSMKIWRVSQQSLFLRRRKSTKSGSKRSPPSKE
jgi:hypothetical protein